MPDWLQFFALARFGRPLLLFLASSAVLWMVLRRAGAKTASAVHVLLSATASVALGAFVVVAVWYATDKRYYDFAEPTMPAVAWMFEIGKPLYPPPDAPERYAHIYGPMAFIPLAAAMRVFGTGLDVTKWVGASAGIISLLLLFSILKPRAGARLAAVFTGYCALLLLVFRNAAFWVRPDSLELLCTSIGLFAALHRSRVSWVALGVSAGILWNLKFTGPLYSLPIFVLFLERTSRRDLVLATVTAAMTLAVPFVVFSNISWRNYGAWILLSGSKGIVWSTLRQNLEWAVYLVAPLIVALRVTVRNQPLTVLSPRVATSLVVALGSVAVLASKPGAGPYHLLPFLPVIAFFTGLQMYHLRSDGAHITVLLSGLSFTAVAVVIASAQQASFVSTVRQLDALGPIADLTRFLDQHPGNPTQIGYSSDERTTFVRPLAVFRSGMYLLDQPAIQEHQLAGIEIPPATVNALRSCAVTYWLIPRTGEPFSATNRYPMMHGRALFVDDFRRAFFDTYERIGSTEYFDVWTCR
jgi:dolichyl-phosphate-mannose-protein mannosyltransferase